MMDRVRYHRGSRIWGHKDWTPRTWAINDLRVNDGYQFYRFLFTPETSERFCPFKKNGGPIDRLWCHIYSLPVVKASKTQLVIYNKTRYFRRPPNWVSLDALTPQRKLRLNDSQLSGQGLWKIPPWSVWAFALCLANTATLINGLGFGFSTLILIGSYHVSWFGNFYLMSRYHLCWMFYCYLSLLFCKLLMMLYKHSLCIQALGIFYYRLIVTNCAIMERRQSLARKILSGPQA